MFLLVTLINKDMNKLLQVSVIIAIVIITITSVFGCTDERYVFEKHQVNIEFIDKYENTIIFVDNATKQWVSLPYSYTVRAINGNNFYDYDYYVLYYPDDGHSVFYKAIRRK